MDTDMGSLFEGKRAWAKSIEVGLTRSHMYIFIYLAILKIEYIKLNNFFSYS